MNGPYLQKWHIPPKMAHSSINGIFLQKWHIPPKKGIFLENVTFIQNWHIPPKMAHSSKNGTFLQKCHVPPKMTHYSKKTFSPFWKILRTSIIATVFTSIPNLPSLVARIFACLRLLDYLLEIYCYLTHVMIFPRLLTLIFFFSQCTCLLSIGLKQIFT